MLWLVAFAILAIAVAGWFNRGIVSGYSSTGTAYAARVGCSCRFVAGRSLADCEKDKVAGMELVSLSEDAAARSVTATFPLIGASTATWREGYGCMLETWEG